MIRLKIITHDKGSIGNLIMLVLIIGIFAYFFVSSSEDKNYVEIGTKEAQGYLNARIAGIKILGSLKDGTITVPESGQSQDLKNGNFIINITRGKDLKDGGKTISCYLVQTYNELEPRKAIQFLVIGFPDGVDGYSYHIVTFRNKSLKG